MRSSLVSYILFSFFFFIWGKTSALIVPRMTPLNTTFCSMVVELSDQICTPICHRVQRRKKTNIYPSDVTTLVLFRARTCVHCTPWMLKVVRVGWMSLGLKAVQPKTNMLDVDCRVHNTTVTVMFPLQMFLCQSLLCIHSFVFDLSSQYSTAHIFSFSWK